SAHFFAYRLGPPEELGAFLVGNVAGAWNAEWVGEVGAQGWMSVRAAVTAIGRNRSLTSLLRACVDFGGDVDTVAAIALGAASMSEDYARDLPAALVNGLEDGPFGRDFLRSLDRRLLERFGFEPRTYVARDGPRLQLRVGHFHVCYDVGEAGGARQGRATQGDEEDGGHPMKIIALRDARASLSSYVEQAQGDRLLITKHGRPAALLIG